MGIPVVTGGQAMCTFGAGIFNLISTRTVLFENKPVLTIMDKTPLVNVVPSGVICSAIPITPKPCSPIFAAPWTVGTLKSRVNNFAIVDNTCKLICSLGGVLSVINPGATKVTVT